MMMGMLICNEGVMCSGRAGDKMEGMWPKKKEIRFPGRGVSLSSLDAVT